MPVYNAAGRVRRAVASALAQSEVGEVLLVEDCSPDDALKVCQELEQSDSRVRVLRHSDGGNHGAGASRNLGVSRARFAYVAFLDADDWYLPGRFEVSARVLTEQPSVDGVYEAVGHDFENAALRRQWEDQGRPHVTTVSEAVPPEELILVLLWVHDRARGEFHTNGVTLRREFFDRVGGFHPDLRLQQDTHLWRRLAAGGRMSPGRIAEVVAMHSVHGGNRMTKVEDHGQYMDLWWHSLGHSLREMRVSSNVWHAYRQGYAAFCADSGSRGRALWAVARWVFGRPSDVARSYGFFDLTVCRILGNNLGVQHALSFKNRLVRLFRS